jgi:hypothetical protein
MGRSVSPRSTFEFPQFSSNECKLVKECNRLHLSLQKLPGQALGITS